MSKIIHHSILVLLLALLVPLASAGIPAAPGSPGGFSGLLTVTFDREVSKEKRPLLIEQSFESFFLWSVDSPGRKSYRNLPDSLLRVFSESKNGLIKTWDQKEEALRQRGFTITNFAFTLNMDSVTIQSASIGFRKKYGLDEVSGSIKIDLGSHNETMDLVLKPNVTTHGSGIKKGTTVHGNAESRVTLFKKFLTEYSGISFLADSLKFALMSEWRSRTNLTFAITLIPDPRIPGKKTLVTEKDRQKFTLQEPALQHGILVNEYRVWEDLNGLHYRHEDGKIYSLPVGKKMLLGEIDGKKVYTRGQVDLFSYFGRDGASYIWNKYYMDFEGLGLKGYALVYGKAQGVYLPNQEFMVFDKSGKLAITNMVVDELALCYAITEKGYYFKLDADMLHLPVHEEKRSDAGNAKIRWVYLNQIDSMVESIASHWKPEHQDRIKIAVRQKLEGDLREKGIAYKKESKL